MRKLAKIFLPLVLLLACAACAAETPPPEIHPIAGAASSGRLIDARQFVERGAFDTGAPPASLPQGVKALIVPHHTVAARLAARLIGGLAEQAPKTIILLGPNHPADGPKIATTYAAFTTYHGTLRPRADLVRALESRRLAGISDALFEKEHSIGALAPLISRYLPDAGIVPMIFQRGVSLQNARKAIGTVYSIDDEDAVIIASIDFSHGLSPREEPARRAGILAYIEAYDWRAILGLDDTYLDAPVVLAALLQLLQEHGCNRMQLFDSANAADVLGYDVPDATGYLTMAFY